MDNLTFLLVCEINVSGKNLVETLTTGIHCLIHLGGNGCLIHLGTNGCLIHLRANSCNQSYLVAVIASYNSSHVWLYWNN